MAKQTINNDKKYYLVDNVLIDSSKDSFHHEDLSNNILSIVKNEYYKTPYSIALIGKWGLGKSSILKFVETNLNKENYKYKVININAWEYEKENIRIVLLKKLICGLDGNKNSTQILKDLINKLNNKPIKKEIKIKFKDVCNYIKKVSGLIGWVLLLSGFTGYIKILLIPSSLVKIISTRGLFWFLLKCADYTFENFFTNLIITIALIFFKNIFEEVYSNVKKPLDISPILNDTIYYEEILDEILKEKRYKNIKIIIIVDDMDRLSINKMLEMLDALKILMKKNKLIFIVPFDDSILKKVLEKQVVNHIDSEHNIINSELVLDKVFKFKFYLNPLIPSNMKSYTLKLIDDELKDIYDIINKEEMKDIVNRVLIHKGVETPRQVKKIINVFISNYLILKNRCEKSKDKNNLLDFNGKMILAKLSVLQADFNDFYDTLLIDNNNINNLIELNEKTYNDSSDNKLLLEQIPYELRFVFESKENSIKIKNEYLSLINFLRYTRTISHDKISSYLFLNETDIDIRFNSKINHDLTNAMESGSFDIVIKYIKESNQNLSELILYIIENTDEESIVNVLRSSLKMIKYIQNVDNQIKFISDSISFRVNTLFFDDVELIDYEEIDISDIIIVYKNVSNNHIDGIQKLLISYIKKMEDNNFEDNSKIYDILNSVINSEIEFNNAIYSSIKNVVLGMINKNKININEVIENVQVHSENRYIDCFGKEFLILIKDYYIENDITGVSESDWIFFAINSMINNNVDISDVTNIIEELYQNESNITLLNKFTLKIDNGDK